MKESKEKLNPIQKEPEEEKFEGKEVEKEVRKLENQLLEEKLSNKEESRVVNELFDMYKQDAVSWGDIVHSSTFESLRDKRPEKFKEVVQLVYEKVAEAGTANFEKAQISMETDISPSEEILQKGYEVLIKRGRQSEIKFIAEKYGIKPKKELAPLAYKKAVEDGEIYLLVEEIPDLYGVSFQEVNIPQEVLDKGFNKLARKGEIGEIEKGLKILKDKPQPVFKTEEAQEGYVTIMKEGWPWMCFKKLHELTGIAPTKDTLIKSWNAFCEWSRLEDREAMYEKLKKEYGFDWG